MSSKSPSPKPPKLVKYSCKQKSNTKENINKANIDIISNKNVSKDSVKSRRESKIVDPTHNNSINMNYVRYKLIAAARVRKQKNLDLAHTIYIELADLFLQSVNGSNNDTIHPTTTSTCVAHNLNQTQSSSMSATTTSSDEPLHTNESAAACLYIYQQCLEIKRELKDVKGQMDALLQLGCALAFLKDFPGSIAFYEEFIKLARSRSKKEPHTSIPSSEEESQVLKSIASKSTGSITCSDEKDKNRENCFNSIEKDVDQEEADRILGIRNLIRIYWIYAERLSQTIECQEEDQNGDQGQDLTNCVKAIEYFSRWYVLSNSICFFYTSNSTFSLITKYCAYVYFKKLCQC